MPGWLFGSTPGVRKPVVNGPPNPLAFNPGSARCAIQISTASASQDAFGQPVTSWAPYLDIYCEIRMLSGQELYQGNEFTSAAQWRMRMRWPGPSVVIKVGDRVFYESHVYVVQIVNNVLLRNVIVELTCLELEGSSQ